MKKERKKNNIDYYEKLYEELKIKYENKEKENEQLKILLKLRDKEIISLQTKLKSIHNNKLYDVFDNNNDDIDEISQNYIEILIKNEIENIQKEKLIYRNKVLTLENFELQYLAPKLTTGNNQNYKFPSNKIMNYNIDNLYLNMKCDIIRNNKTSNKVKLYKNNVRNEKIGLHQSFGYMYDTYGSLNDEGNNKLLKTIYNKTLYKSNRK